MSIAEEVAGILGRQEIEAIRSVLHGEEIGGVMAKRLKTLRISNPKGRKPLTLYGYRVVDLLERMGRWKS